jgi:predicted MFS family arabinose efflux permease
MTQASGHHGISRGLTLLFAVAGGAAVANLYYAQPLLDEIGRSLHVRAGSVGLLVTVTQLGYASGVFLVVPLGDTMNRRRLIPAIMACSAVALIAAALAPAFWTLLIALAAVGLTSVTGQLLTPLAGDLANDGQRGRVVGTVVSGLLTGILISRTVGGLVADAFGWRAVFLAASTVTLLLAALLACAIPTVPARPAVSYMALLASVFATVRRHRVVQVTLLLGAAAFAAFTMFWTALTFLLDAPPFLYSTTQIGLVGLVGLAGLVGALAAQPVGRLYDRGWSVSAAGFALGVALGALVVARLASTSIVVLLVAVVLLDAAIQATNVLNQTRLFSVDPSARSRLNTAFVVSNFIGGAVGSTITGVLWQFGGWSAVTAGAATLIAIALTVWVTQRTRSLGSAGEHLVRNVDEQAERRRALCAGRKS